LPLTHTSPLKGAQKTQNGRYTCKIALRFKRICYKVYLLSENYQQQSCKVFIGLTIRAEMIVMVGTVEYGFVPNCKLNIVDELDLLV